MSFAMQAGILQSIARSRQHPMRVCLLTVACLHMFAAGLQVKDSSSRHWPADAEQVYHSWLGFVSERCRCVRVHSKAGGVAAAAGLHMHRVQQTAAAAVAVVLAGFISFATNLQAVEVNVCMAIGLELLNSLQDTWSPCLQPKRTVAPMQELSSAHTSCKLNVC